jgi:hypothetical protein
MEEVADMTRIVVFENVTLDGVMQATTLSLVDSTPTTTGVIIARYRPVT